MSITILQLQKRSSYEFKNIQDKFSFNPNNLSFALADGTTQSFNSEIWADLIAKEFVSKPTFDFKEIIAKFKNQAEQFSSRDFQFSSNPAIASIEKAKKQKGATATLIGIQFLDATTISYISCGDSCLFLFKENNSIHPYPFSDIDALNRNNYFLNTQQLVEDKIEENFFSKNTFTSELGDTLIVATDALSRFIFKFPEKIVEILAINNFEGLRKFCVDYWESKELEEDDISALIIKLDSKDVINQILPGSNFSFPKEKEPDFVPSVNQISSTNFSDMQFQEIVRQFNGVKNDFEQVKKKQKQNELYLLVAISLLIINLFFTYYLRPSKVNADVKPAKENSDEIYQTLVSKINSLERKLDNTAPRQVADTPKKNDKDATDDAPVTKEKKSKRNTARKSKKRTDDD